ncbi:MAG: hypothetical protein JWO30_356 [Fibrobacteres bacterium]|nr:hypothetical protein [Fibrobacterota bacterium]
MAEENPEARLPALNTPKNWAKIIVVFAAIILINVVAFLVSFGAGVIVTIPLTLFLAFLLLRDIVPSHRFPPGRRP